MDGRSRPRRSRPLPPAAAASKARRVCRGSVFAVASFTSQPSFLCALGCDDASGAASSHRRPTPDSTRGLACKGGRRRVRGREGGPVQDIRGSEHRIRRCRDHRRRRHDRRRPRALSRARGLQRRRARRGGLRRARPAHQGVRDGGCPRQRHRRRHRPGDVPALRPPCPQRGRAGQHGGWLHRVCANLVIAADDARRWRHASRPSSSTGHWPRRPGSSPSEPTRANASARPSPAPDRCPHRPADGGIWVLRHQDDWPRSGGRRMRHRRTSAAPGSASGSCCRRAVACHE